MAINLAKEVATLRHMTVSDLRDRYQAVFGEDTNARNIQWPIKRISWKLQANAEGDISKRKRRLDHQIGMEADSRTSLPRVTRPATTETLETASTAWGQEIGTNISAGEIRSCGSGWSSILGRD